MAASPTRTHALLLAAVAVLGAGAGAPAGVTGQEPIRLSEASAAWLGIGYDVHWLQAGDRCQPRVVVESVIHGSPAQRAGLRPGDVILDVDGEPAPGSRLRRLAARLAPGDSVRLRLERSGAVRLVTAVADRRPARPPTAATTIASGWLSRTSAPVVRIRGDTLEAWNIEPGFSLDRSSHSGYWISRSDGGTEYRRLGGWSRDPLDRRVAELLVCSDTLHPEDPPLRVAHAGGGARRDLERADSLRVVIARRTYEAAGDRQKMIVRLERDGAGPAALLRRVEEGMRASLPGLAGAEMVPLEPELAEYFRGAAGGLLVLRVAPGSPAQRAGLRPGDVLTSGDGEPLTGLDDLRRALAGADRGPVELRLVRHGRARTVTLRED